MRDGYTKRFPELESINLSPTDYAKVVLAIGTATEIAKVDLSSILPPAILLVVTMSATTSSGVLLGADGYLMCHQIAKTLLEMIEAKRALMGFVEGMMSRIAPNVTAIIGSSVASQLISATGGIKQLSMIPAGNIQVIGSTRKELLGLSIASAKLHAGFIDQCDLVQNTAPENQTRAQRLVAAKVVLAARIDALRSQPSGSQGASFRQEIMAKLEKLAEPAPLKAVKPIPPPALESKTKRGGKRARKQKELLAMTKVRKLQNRVSFGEAEKETFVGDSVVGLGMLGSSGALRNPQIDNKAREAIKKQSKKATTGFFSSTFTPSTTSVRQATNGMATSLTISTGIGLSNPASASATTPKASRYFNTSSSFKKTI